MGVEIIGGNPGTEYRALAIAQRKRFIREQPLGKTDPGSEVPHIPGQRAQEDAVYLNEALQKLKTVGDIFNRRLDFRVDEETNRIIVKVIDTETDKVIKEIPPEQLVELAAKIQKMIGLLVDEER